MKRSITSSVLVFLITALLGTALNVRAEAKAAQECGDSQLDTQDDDSVYWAR